MSQKTVALEVRSPPDGMGRRYFVARWFDEGFHLGPMQRGQVFFDDVEKHAASWRAAGFTVVICDAKEAV